MCEVVVSGFGSDFVEEIYESLMKNEKFSSEIRVRVD